MANATLMRRYSEYNDSLKAQGINLVAFDCPSCKQSIETQPAPKGDVWDTLSNCAHCNAMFMKITKVLYAQVLNYQKSKQRVHDYIVRAAAEVIQKQC